MATETDGKIKKGGFDLPEHVSVSGAELVFPMLEEDEQYLAGEERSEDRDGTDRGAVRAKLLIHTALATHVFEDDAVSAADLVEAAVEVEPTETYFLAQPLLIDVWAPKFNQPPEGFTRLVKARGVRSGDYYVATKKAYAGKPRKASRPTPKVR